MLMKQITAGKKSSLLRRAMLVFVLLSIVPTIIVIITVNKIYSENLYEQSQQLIRQNAKQHELLIRERLDHYEDSFFELISSEEFIDLAATIDQQDKLYTADYQEMQVMMQSAVYSLPYIRCVAFIADNDLCVPYSKWYDRSGISMVYDEDSRERIREDIGDTNRRVITSAYNLLEGTNQSDPVFLMGMPVRNLITKDRSGILLYAISTDMLLYQQGAASNEGVETCVIDYKDYILNGTNDKAIGMQLTEYLNQEYKDKNYYKIIQGIEGTEWKANYIVDIDVQRRELKRFNYNVLLLMILVIGGCFIIVMRFTRGYIRKIRDIGTAIENYNPDDSQPLKIHLDKNDDLYFISHQFNRMVDRNNSLVEMLRQKNHEIKEASERQKNAEIKALEAQINPHFLYNTLDSINWRAIDAGEEEISNMLGMLGSLFRYSVSNINGIVPLSVEIEWLQKYVYLQRERFNDSFDCIYEATDESLDFPIYKMLLQPLIENSILHAFEETKAGGVIMVKAFVRKDRKLQISIKDNGSGMSDQQLESLRRNVLEKKALDSQSIGISNIVNRLKIYYQDDAELRVESEQGCGSEFILVIPETKKNPWDRQDKE